MATQADYCNPDLFLRCPLPEPGIRVREAPGEIELEVSLTATKQLYYRIDGRRLSISDDLRVLRRGRGELDERGIYSLLQYGAIVPPYSPWKDIRRITPGARTVFRFEPVTIQERPLRRAQREACIPASLEEQATEVVSRLDGVLLARCRRGPVIVLFSGGVDSGLLAARAAALRLPGTRLVNLAFGDEDPESLLAEEMARYLDLPFTRIQADGVEIEELLESAGELYRSPFGDHSTGAMYSLAKAVVGLGGDSGTVLDGSGADGAFGLSRKSKQWSRLCAVPRSIAAAASACYQTGRLWRAETKAEYYLRLVRRAGQLGFPFAAVAHNGLDGIAYHVSDGARREVRESAAEWLGRIDGKGPAARLTAVDLALTCSAIFAQKSRALFDASSLDAIYPFLTDEMVETALGALTWPGRDSEPKAILKAALSRQTPKQMVYRRKSAFVAPLEEQFRRRAFLRAFDRLNDPEAPVAPFMNDKFLRSIRPLLAGGERLPAQTASLVWTAVFVNQWLEQVKPRKLKFYSRGQ